MDRMLRLALPVMVLLAAAYVAWQNLDGDGEYLLLPFVEVLPFVGEGLYARGLATSGLLGGLGLISLGAQALSWRRAVARERRDDAHMGEAEQLRTWHEENAWDGDVLETEAEEQPVSGAGSRAGDETPARGD